MRAARLSLLAVIIGGLGAVSPAGADIVAAVDVPVAGSETQCPGHFDIALLNAATGSRTTLPAGINTAADEVHPNISSLGNRMVFERFDRSAQTTRIIAVDMGTGQQADLFNVFGAQQVQPNTPALTPDASNVIAGAAFAQPTSSQFTPVDSVTSLLSFPGGPFTHSTRVAGPTVANDGETVDPVERSDGLFAAGIQTESPLTEEIVLDTGGGVFKVASETGAELTYPAFSDPTTNVLVFQRFSSEEGLSRARLAFRPVGTFASATSTELPAAVNIPGEDILHPAFTPGGRYLGFVAFAHSGDHHLRLFVFDTQTQTLVRSGGIDLGDGVSFGCPAMKVWSGSGGLSLRETFQLVSNAITFTGSIATISFQLAQPTGVGLFVQRIVGQHRLFGHRVPKLKTVGRVPLGMFRRGHHKVHWRLRVHGHRLARGRYLVTPRLVTRRGVVHELGKPRRLRVR